MVKDYIDSLRFFGRSYVVVDKANFNTSNPNLSTDRDNIIFYYAFYYRIRFPSHVRYSLCPLPTYSPSSIILVISGLNLKDVQIQFKFIYLQLKFDFVNRTFCPKFRSGIISDT